MSPHGHAATGSLTTPRKRCSGLPVTESGENTVQACLSTSRRLRAAPDPSDDSQCPHCFGFFNQFLAPGLAGDGDLFVVDPQTGVPLPIVQRGTDWRRGPWPSKGPARHAAPVDRSATAISSMPLFQQLADSIVPICRMNDPIKMQITLKNLGLCHL